MNKFYLVVCLLILSRLCLAQSLFVPNGNVGVSANQNVGVGINNPLELLHLQGGKFLLRNLSGLNNAAHPVGLKFTTDNTNTFAEILIRRGADSDKIGLQFNTHYFGLKETMTLLNNRVGIGVVEPSSKLHIIGSPGEAVLQAHYVSASGLESIGLFKGQGFTSYTYYDASSSGEPRFTFIRSRGSSSEPSPTITGDNLGELYWDAGNGVGSKHAASIRAIVAGDKTNGVTPARMEFSVTPKGSDQNFPSTQMVINHDGNVGIGTKSPDAPLTVKGRIHAEEVKVDLSVPAPDYVFAPDYKLSSLQEIEAYIQENSHLPEVPSAAEMEAEGIELSKMNMLLLKKVEELTLYTLQQEKKISKQQAELMQKEHAIAELNKRLEAIEALLQQADKHN